MTTYLLIKSAGSNHVTSVAVFDGGIGMKYEFAENEARRINAAIDKAANVDAAVAAEREACAKVAETIGHGTYHASDMIAAAIRARNEAQS